MEADVQKILYSFFGKFGVKAFAKGEIIVSPKTNKIFFLTQGVVRMSVASKKKREITLNIYKPHALFTMSLVFDIGNHYLYEALTEAQGYLAPANVFRQFINKNHAVLFDLIKRVYLGLDGYFTIIEALLSGDAYYRILTQLIIYARRFGKLKQGIITFDWHLTHEQLASQTGLARESVTKEIKKLQDKNLLGYSGKRIFIYSLSELEEECFSHLSKIR